MYVSSERRLTMTDDEPSPKALSTEIASSTASSIYITWEANDDAVLDDVISPSVIQGYRVHYQKVASTYVQYSHFMPPDASGYSISNLVADTYYKVCVVMYRNDTSSPERDCVDAATTSWHIPVSIGSSIGAVLALSIIVLIVLLSRCPSLMRRQRASASESSKYDSMTSSRYPDDHNEFSDTTTHCHDHDDDVFSQSSEGHPLDSYRHCHHPHTYPNHNHAPLPERLCNGNKNQAFIGVGAGGASGGISPRHAHHHAHHYHHRAHSLGACGRSHSLERPRPHHSRRSQLMQLHSAHQSIQSEPAVSSSSTPRPLHVSISDLPPAVHIPDPDAPVSTLVTGGSSGSGGGGGVSGSGGGGGEVGVAVGGARAKTSLKDTPRTFHMSIDYDV
ncbi:uncharacterized protein [Littorina saxatilis]|uniref:Fibronectin type-III domain-containing protein n=1 Tax=Littorina saxatilis TaxID=31220 RepID=A0AAN9BQQ7_9CAEN